MPRTARLRRPVALVAALVVLPSLLAACGDSEGQGNGLEFADRLDAVTIGGDAGEPPTIEWKSRMTAKAPESKTLVEGDGEPLADGDQVFVNFVLGDGFTRDQPIDTFGADSAGIRLTVGAEPAQPASLNDLVATFLTKQIKAGVTRGTRIAITGDTEAVFGEGFVASPVLAESNIGNQDGLLVVADVLDVEQLDKPNGTQQELPAWAPKINFVKTGKSKGQPASFDFTDVPEPTDDLLTAVIKKGTGEAVEKGDLLVADYLGQVYDGKEPFDQSYTPDKEPYPTPIGLGQVVKGWDQGLVGVPVGSRVLLQIPPNLGYGKKGSGEQIPGGSTLYFVIDVLASI